MLAASAALLALAAAAVPLSRLARQSLNASGGSVPVWVVAPFAVVGLVVAWRRPGNPLGWIMLGGAFFGALSEDASFYTVADYRLRHGGLPLGWLALLAQPGWAPAIMMFGLTVLLFPDGRLPSPRWRWPAQGYAAVGLLWIASALVLTVGAITGHHARVDSGGNLLQLTGGDQSASWFNVVQWVFFPVLAACWLASLARQVLGYRRSSGERRQQLKWLMAGSAFAFACVPLAVLAESRLLGTFFALAGFFALPLCIGVAILRYRLFDIDRIISRTLAYAIVTGLLVGVYAGLVLLATQVFTIRSPVVVAVATLAAAALFNPVRHRVQHVVDRRFNRARYDADTAITAFAARLQDAVDLDSVSDDLARVVTRSLEPAHLSVWIKSLLTTTNPAWIICAGQLLARIFAALVVAAHNGPAQTLWRPYVESGAADTEHIHHGMRCGR